MLGGTDAQAPNLSSAPNAPIPGAAFASAQGQSITVLVPKGKWYGRMEGGVGG